MVDTSLLGTTGVLIKRFRHRPPGRRPVERKAVAEEGQRLLAVPPQPGEEAWKRFFLPALE